MMRDDEIMIALDQGSGALTHDPSTQAVFREFSVGLEAAGIKASSRIHTRDAAGAAGWSLGQYLVPLAQIAVPTLGVVLGNWIKAGFGRKIRIKVGEISIEAGTVEEVERLIPFVKELQTKAAKGKRP